MELIVNLLILGFSLFSYFYVGATMPVSPVSELGAEQWPQLIIILMVIALVFNIYGILKKGKGGALAENFKSLAADTVKFFSSKLFIAMVIVVVMSLTYEPLGFMTTSFFFILSYGYLLGERRPLVLILAPIIITAILYIGFAVFLSVLLPRGNVPFLRNFALFVESIIPTF